jgi:hypothetical protein
LGVIVDIRCGTFAGVVGKAHDDGRSVGICNRSCVYFPKNHASEFD